MSEGFLKGGNYRAKLLAGLLVCGVAVWLAFPSAPSVRLSNGTKVRFLGASVGTNVFTTEGSLARLVKKILPARYQGMMPAPVTGRSGNTNSVNFWFQVTGQSNVPGAIGWRSVEISSSGDRPYYAGSPVVSAAGIVTISPPVFERRRPLLSLRFFSESWASLGVMDLPNPLRGPLPEWKPDPFPITRTNGDLTVTLKKVSRLREERWGYLGWTTNDSLRWTTNDYVRVEWEFRQVGKLTHDWIDAGGPLEDATGNWIGGWHFGLPLNEKAWRWKGRFQRKPGLDYPPEDRFVITNIAVPPEGEFTVLDQSTNLHGLHISVAGLASAGTVTTSNGIPVHVGPLVEGQDGRQLGYATQPAWFETNIFKHPTMFLALQEHRQTGSGLRVNYVFRDHQGNVLGQEYNTKPESPSVRLRQLGIQGNEIYLRPVLTNGARNISLEVIVQRTPQFEFTFAPPTEVELRGAQRRPTQTTNSPSKAR